MPWQIPLLQRYIFAEIVKVFAFVLVCQTVLLVFVGVFQQATESGLGPIQILEILPYIVPSLLPFTIPAALLLTICVVYGRMAGDNEVTAAKAAGISVTTLLWPAFFLGAILSAASLLLTDQAIPWAMTNIQQRIVTAMEDVFLDRLRTEHQFREKKRGIDVTVQRVEGRRLIQPIFQYRRSGGQVATIMADEAFIRLDLPNERAILKLKNAYLDIPPNAKAHHSGEMVVPIEWRSNLGQSKPRHLRVQDIHSELEKVKREQQQLEERRAVEVAMMLTKGQFREIQARRDPTVLQLSQGKERTKELRTEVHSRFAMACSCFFFTILGGPFAVMKAKSHFLTSFLYCFVPIVTGYYPVFLMTIVQSRKGNLDPQWSVWIANALVGIIGLVLLRRVQKY